MDQLNEYLVPLAVCGAALVAGFVLFKNSMAVEPLPQAAPVPKKEKKTKKKAEKKAPKAAPVVAEESASEVEEAPKPAAPAPTGKKTGAQKRKEKKEREAAAAAAASGGQAKKADAPKKAAPKKTAAPAKVAAEPKPVVAEEAWETVDVVAKSKKATKETKAAPVEEAAAPVNKKEQAKKAKDRSAKQKAASKPDDYLKNLPEEVQAQLRRFNNYDGGDSPASPAKSNNNLSDDAWAEIPSKVQPSKKSKPAPEEKKDEPIVALPVRHVQKREYTSDNTFWSSQEKAEGASKTALGALAADGW